MQEKITTIKKDNMPLKEKIEEIVDRHLNMRLMAGVPFYETSEMGIKVMLSELSTLIQAERKEAVEGFVDNIGWKKPSEVIDLADDVIDGRSLVKQMEAYLQSSDKGDTDENR